MPRTFITFRAEFSDDGEWSPDGAPVTPGGRNVALEIIAGLRQHDLRVEGPTRHSFYGWAFSFDHAWCMLQRPDTWLLIVEDRSPLLERILRRGEVAARLQRALDALSEVLKADARIADTRSFTKSEYERLPRDDGRG